jgi:hypothetical protein
MSQAARGGGGVAAVSMWQNAAMSEDDHIPIPSQLHDTADRQANYALLSLKEQESTY